MKSWAHTYLAGSLLGTALIVAALVAFVPLVALNAPDEWPALGLGLVGGGRGGSEVGVSAAAIVTTAQSQGTGGLEAGSGPSSTGSAATVAINAPSREISGRRPGGAEVNAAPEPVAVSPASVEVVARDPSPPGPERAGAAPSPLPTPNPTETGGAPAPAATGGEPGGVAEMPAPGPIDAGAGGEEAGGEEPEPAPPPEGSGSIPPPETTGEEGAAPGSPGEDDEGEALPEHSETSGGGAPLPAAGQAGESCPVTRCVSVEQLFGIARLDRLR